jgi:hypothetical protein
MSASNGPEVCGTRTGDFWGAISGSDRLSYTYQNLNLLLLFTLEVHQKLIYFYDKGGNSMFLACKRFFFFF